VPARALCFAVVKGDVLLCKLEGLPDLSIRIV
jgi:hypothetical protein